ncbi:MAG TPA: methionyl-tRNA formyltransferase [Burkholderiales bacterium]|nr:methionyl-tRNA formyltransferase [Burkholderiales bacterium]
MKLIFAGTPDFAAIALDTLVRAGHDIALVLTQPDRPAGRGLKTVPSAVKAVALRLGLPVGQPASLRDAATVSQLRAVEPDAMIVAAYGLILPTDVLSIPRLGCINIHASLLPRWRGAAPIQRAILAGDRETGITIMQMDAGLDTGPVLLQQVLLIAPDDTAATLHDKLADLGAELVVRVLHDRPPPVPQDEATATYAAKIDKREAHIDWTQAAAVIERQVRAFNPVPGASTTMSGQPLKICAAKAQTGERGEPGTVIAASASGIDVCCGQGLLRIAELQRAGGKRMGVAAFLSGTAVHAGMRLGA